MVTGPGVLPRAGRYCVLALLLASLRLLGILCQAGGALFRIGLLRPRFDPDVVSAVGADSNRLPCGVNRWNTPEHVSLPTCCTTNTETHIIPDYDL